MEQSKQIFSSKEEFIQQYKAMFTAHFGREFEACGDRDRYTILAHLIADKARLVKSQTMKRDRERKKVYYFSMEFLIGRLLENYLINFGIKDLVSEGLSELGVDLETLFEQEPDPGLGNGGLGRLAACFIDSMASMDMPGHGNGIHFRYGLFRQEIVDGCQVEKPDYWLEHGFPWEVRKQENAVVVRFGGTVNYHKEGDRFWYTWDGGEPILAVPYDVPIVGYGGTTVNTLRLWSAEPYQEDFDLEAYNRGDYSGAMRFRSDVEAISHVLYPKDSADPGKILRLKQEYMFVAAGISTIISTYKKEHGTDWKHFPDWVAIQINDTHPALCAPELMRILVDEEGLSWDEAWEIAVAAISYTNHTVLPEALEVWPIDMFQKLLPRVYDFVREIDRRFRENFSQETERWQSKLQDTAIFWNRQIRMANLAIISGHAVNGVAALHTEILKRDVLKDFYELMPEKFSNKTNGIAHRRFLLQANPTYSKLITGAIGDGWIRDASQLQKLTQFEGDAGFLEDVRKSKEANKIRLAKYILDSTGVAVDTQSIFDVQVKRFHAYKRQLLNLLKIMDLYNRVQDDPNLDITPSTFIFSGKAAQGYVFAKDVIRLVNTVAEVVNSDPKVNGRLKVVFIPNFSVSNAQLIYPASDISEQISTAGMEASGTGNMKFMMNGAVTLGTLDGATVEIAELVGEENIEIFGLRAERIEQYKREYNYMSWDEYHGSPRIKRVMDQLIDGTYSGKDGVFNGVFDSVTHGSDEFFVLKDFLSYTDAWDRLSKKYEDKDRWAKMSLHNTARSGFFSSDRTIAQYASDIWQL